MSEEDPKQQQEQEAPDPEETGSAPETGEQEAGSLEEQLEALRQERDELRDRLMRVSADYQNYVRRAQQNVETAREQQLRDVAKALLPVLDHFDHAVAADAQSSSAESVLQGVQMVHQELLKALDGFQIQRVDVERGEEFDPNRHEAILRQPTNEYAPNQVVDQIQPGYLLGEKLLRPAQVSVAEAPQEEAASESGGEEQ